jgi:RimJ/RimL family protein N-acetyltransferase
VSVLETERLRLRELTLDDAPFILRLLNDPAWLEFIGDRGVRTVEAARDYLSGGPLKMYREHGLGLWLV